MPHLSKQNFRTTHAPNVTDGRLVALDVPKYYFDERPAPSQSACRRQQGPNTRPENSAERRMRVRWLGRRTFGRGQPNRRGREAVKVFSLVAFPFSLRLGTSPKGNIAL